MKTVDKYDIVIVGNYIKDTIVNPSGTQHADGGGLNYGAHVVAMMNLRTAAVTRLAREDSRVVDALIQLGVDVYPTYTPHSTMMRLYYPTNNVDERILSVKHTAGSFTTDQLDHLDAGVFLLNASVRGEVSLDFVRKLREKKRLIVADVQGFVRTIGEDGTILYEDWPEKEKMLPYIDILKTDAVEAEHLTGDADIRTAAKKIANWGPKEIVLTHRNGLLIYADDMFYDAEFYPEKLVGRTGRGDTCLAAYTAKRLSASPADATIWAAAATSLKMEAQGPIRRTKTEVEDLIIRKYRVKE